VEKKKKPWTVWKKGKKHRPKKGPDDRGHPEGRPIIQLKPNVENPANGKNISGRQRRAALKTGGKRLGTGKLNEKSNLQTDLI